MKHYPQQLFSAEQVKKIEDFAISELALSQFGLMQRAAAALLALILEKYPAAKKLLIVCGSGNNGGDGYCLALIAQAQNFQVSLLSASAASSKMAKQARQKCQDAKIKIHTDMAVLDDEYDIIVDAIFGIGLNRAIEEPQFEAIQKINQNPAVVISADIPSGVIADTGQVLTTAVKANATVSFLCPKLGLYTGDAVNYTGRIYIDTLGLSSEHLAKFDASASFINHDYIKKMLPKRAAGTHKGQCGHVLIIGGAATMAGAVLLAADAALRSGAGLVSVATSCVHATELITYRPEIMIHPIADAAQLEPLIEKADVLAVGMGLGQSDWSQSMFQAAIGAAKALVVDADAINILADDFKRRDNWILTPHPLEAARLIGTDVQQIVANRFKNAALIAEHYQALTVLKGAGSIVATPQLAAAAEQKQQLYLLDKGNPGMATAGMGDVLAGIIAALIAQGLSLADAAKVGCYVHADAADRVAKINGTRGIIASDVIANLGKSVNFL